VPSNSALLSPNVCGFTAFATVVPSMV